MNNDLFLAEFMYRSYQGEDRYFVKLVRAADAAEARAKAVAHFQEQYAPYCSLEEIQISEPL